MTDASRAARRRDQAGALLCLAVAGYGAWAGLGWGLRDDLTGEPGSGLFPFLAALGLGALALVLLARPGLAPDEEAEGDGPPNRRRVAGYVVALLAYALLLEPLGHLLVTALVLSFVMLGLEFVRPRTAIAITAGAVLFSWLLFERLLQVPLPRGPF